MPRLLTVPVLFLFLALPSFHAHAQTAAATARNSESNRLVVVVDDDNGIAVAGARVELKLTGPSDLLRCETDRTGRCKFSGLPAGTCDLRVEKAGYYASISSGVQIAAVPEVDITLAAVPAVHEVIDVVESPPAIDPAQISSKEELNGSEVIDIPYPGPHDYRNALAYIPGITPDAFGSPHIAGAESFQTLTLLDGFNVTQPGTGNLQVRTAVDSFRSISIQPSREPAEFGKGSGGILNLNTAMGNDHFRFVSMDFVPSVQKVAGVHLGSWTPIYTLSGPISKGKVWFNDSLDGEYDNNIILASPQNFSDHVWRIDNLAKVQANLTPRNILNFSFLTNYSRDPHSGVTALAPPQTTPVDDETAYIGSVKDQYSIEGGALLETGFGVVQYNAALTPAGTAPYALWFGSAGGNYYLNQHTIARRVQGLTNFYFAPQHWHGRHDFKIGADVDRLDFEGRYTRQPVSFLLAAPPQGQVPQPCATGANGVPVTPSTCSRYSTFSGGNYAATYNFETSAYAQDRWLIGNRLLFEPGVRLDWDEIVRKPLVSPRLAGTYIFDDAGNTKLSAGIGVIYDATFLGWIAQPLQGSRVDYFFDANGNPTDVNGNPASQPVPVPTNFSVSKNTLDAPRFVNWSAAIEKKLPASTFLKAEFIEKRGTRGFVYNSLSGFTGGNFVLQNTRDDRYDAFTVSLRHTFGPRYTVFGAYTRSRSHSNQVLDYGLDLLVWSPQLPGPYGWDVPNRFIGWGILPAKLPAFHSFDIVYSVEARSGLPFNVANDRFQAIPADPPGTFRMPTYFSLNLEAEKRIHLFKRYLAIRGGFENITNHANAAVGNGILDAEHPVPTFIDQAGRSFSARIRFLDASK